MFYWLAGAGILLFLWPVFMIGHLTMTILDHRRHHDALATVLAIAWPVLCTGMIGALDGNLSPPLFGVPLLLVLSAAWMKQDRSFTIGVWLFFLLSTAIVVSFAVSPPEGDVRWPFLLLWPLALAALLTWRRRRLEV